MGLQSATIHSRLPQRAVVAANPRTQAHPPQTYPEHLHLSPFILFVMSSYQKCVKAALGGCSNLTNRCQHPNNTPPKETLILTANHIPTTISNNSGTSSVVTFGQHQPLQRKPTKLKNIVSKAEVFDVLHHKVAEPTQCNEKVCLGSVMSVPGRNGQATNPRTPPEVLAQAKDFLEQYFTSIRRMTSSMLATCPNLAQMDAASQIFPNFLMTLFLSQCSLGDPNRFPRDFEPDTLNDSEYDFIVVGGGTAGSVVAARLAEEKLNDGQPTFSVVLIEAGGDPTSSVTVPGLNRAPVGTDEDWQYYPEPSTEYCTGAPNSQCFWPRGKVLGGSGSINGMAYSRGNLRDYDEWGKSGNTGWNSTNMLYYFKKSEGFDSKNDPRNDVIVDEEYHNRNGPAHVSVPTGDENPITKQSLLGARELGYQIMDPNGKQPFGFGRGQFSITGGERVSSASAFLVPLRNAQNLHVIKYAQVTQVIFENNRAIGVKYYKNDTEYVIKAKKEVILSAGSLNTPQILLHSGVGPKEQLEPLGIKVVNDLPVGENLRDHIRQHIYYKFNADPPQLTEDDVYEYLKNRKGILAQNSVLSVSFVGFINSDGNLNDPSWPNIQSQAFFQINRTTFTDPFHWFNKTYLDKYNRILQNNSIYNFVAILVRPESSGRVFINSTNPLDRIRIVPNYFSNRKDIDTLIAGVRQMQRLAKTKSMRDMLTEPLYFTEHPDPDSDDFWEADIRNFAATIYHPVGTCKMAPEGDPTGVVDPRLRVKGVKGLRVIDASIMPTTTTGNTNAPVVAVAEKGADLVKEDYL